MISQEQALYSLDAMARDGDISTVRAQLAQADAAELNNFASTLLDLADVVTELAKERA